MAVELDLQFGNVTDVAADVLLLKYAQGRFGADEVVAETLVERGICADAAIRPAPWEAKVVETRGVIAPKRVIFLGVPNLRGFRYREMRQFGRQAMEVIRRGGFEARTLTTTVHGSGYGLDSEEAMQSLVFGFQQGLADGPVDGLSRITFVELNQITDGIRNAEFVIADLSGERPNVYLEVGFAWGINRRVLLLAREQTRLHFDLSHHKCIFYKTIKQLARDLEETIKKLAARQCPE